MALTKCATALCRDLNGTAVDPRLPVCDTPKFLTLQRWGRVYMPPGTTHHNNRPPVLLATLASLLALGVVAGAGIFGQAIWRRTRRQKQVGGQTDEHSLLLARWSNSRSASDGTTRSSHSTSSLGLTRRTRVAAVLGEPCEHGGRRRGLEILTLDPLQAALAHWLASQPKAVPGATSSSPAPATDVTADTSIASAHMANADAPHQLDAACGSLPKSVPCQELAPSSMGAGGSSGSASGSLASQRQWGLDTYSLQLATDELEVGRPPLLLCMHRTARSFAHAHMHGCLFSRASTFIPCLHVRIDRPPAVPVV